MVVVIAIVVVVVIIVVMIIVVLLLIIILLIVKVMVVIVANARAGGVTRRGDLELVLAPGPRLGACSPLRRLRHSASSRGLPVSIGRRRVAGDVPKLTAATVAAARSTGSPGARGMIGS